MQKNMDFVEYRNIEKLGWQSQSNKPLTTLRELVNHTCKCWWLFHQNQNHSQAPQVNLMSRNTTCEKKRPSHHRRKKHICFSLRSVDFPENGNNRQGNNCIMSHHALKNDQHHSPLHCHYVSQLHLFSLRVIFNRGAGRLMPKIHSKYVWRMHIIMDKTCGSAKMLNIERSARPQQTLQPTRLQESSFWKCFPASKKSIKLKTHAFKCGQFEHANKFTFLIQTTQIFIFSISNLFMSFTILFGSSYLQNLKLHIYIYKYI